MNPRVVTFHQCCEGDPVWILSRGKWLPGTVTQFSKRRVTVHIDSGTVYRKFGEVYWRRPDLHGLDQPTDGGTHHE